MATPVMFDDFYEDLGNGVHNFSSHTLKVALTNSGPNKATGSVLADISQISAGNGYSSGGPTLDSVTWAETSAGSGVWRLSIADETITASGGSIGPFRYAVIYNDSATSDPLICYLDYGSSITVTDGNTFTLDVGADGIFQLGTGTLAS